MTKINKLVMRGFKSFNNKTEIVFGNSFNCILGPNGSGKSNVLDAMCFVLGKGSSKALRAEKSSNLLYNGGKKRSPAKTGEVSIYFDNKSRVFNYDEDEIKISRIIKQDGTSKYKINDKSMTRNQVLETLSKAKINPDGYNIILQGDITRFTEMPPEKRRKIIEELAGISVYEEKKQKAMKDLEKVEEKLKGADIVLDEKRSHLKELKKDRDQALKYKKLNDQIKENKAAYCKMNLEKKEAELEEVQEKKKKLEDELNQINEQLKSYKDDYKNKKKEMDEISKEIEEKGEKEQVRVSKELENLRVDRAKNKERVNSCNKELDRISQRREDLKQNKQDIENKINSYEKEKKNYEDQKKSKENELKKVEESIEKFKKKNKLDENLDNINKQIEKIDQETEDLQKEIDSYRNKQQELVREKDKQEFMIGNIDERIKKTKEVEKKNKKELEDLKNKKERFKNLTKDLNKKINEDSSLATKISTAKKELNEKEEELSKLNARKAGINEASMQSEAINKILENKSKFNGVYGTVGELGSVSSKYSTALEMAAGGKINSIIVEDDTVASECINFLKKNKYGSATFIPLNKIGGVKKNPDVEKLKNSRGVVDLAVNLVKFDSKFQKAFSYVLGNTLVVDSVDSGRRVGIGKARMVTTEGDVLESSGAMQGGYRKKRKGKGFNELEVSKNLTQVEERVSELRSEISSLEKQREENNKEIERLRNEKSELEGDIIKSEKSLHVESEDLDSSMEQKKEMQEKVKKIDSQLDEVVSNISSKNKELAQKKVERQKLKSKVQELRNPTVLAELNTLEQNKKEINDKITEFSNEIKNLDTQVKSIFMPEKENVDKIFGQLDDEEKSFKNEIQELNKVMSDQDQEIKNKQEEEKKFYSKFKGLFDRRNKLNDEINQMDKKIGELEEKSRKSEHKVNSVGLEEAKIKSEKDTLDREFSQYKDIEIKINKSEQQLKKEINDFEKMKENMGNINMRALEVYDEVEKEFNKLVEKKNTLMKEREKVTNMMKEIESKKKELFMKTYDSVSNNFKSKFNALSGKGDAFLELENKQDPFAGGVSIKVKLSGNKFMDIRGLSGGEKTLTALAFIFAMQDHEPASFYILDEVDSALDKHNSEKLAQMVRSYCNKAQYVMISHNDAIMAEADNLYGVSMGEDYISKINSMKI